MGAEARPLCRAPRAMLGGGLVGKCMLLGLSAMEPAEEGLGADEHSLYLHIHTW